MAVSITNCVITSNTAGSEGGGIYNNNSNVTVVNSIIWANTATTGDSVVNSGTTNAVFSYSDIEGCDDGGSWNTDIGTDGGNNIDDNPDFVDPDGDDDEYGTSDDDLSLDTGSPSPCIGAGIDGRDISLQWPVDSILLGQVTGLTNPVDLVVNSTGNIYVLDSSSSPSEVLIYNDELTLQDTITVSANNPKGIAVDDSDRIYIADTDGNRILRYIYTSSWDLDTTFDDDGIVGETGSGDGQFNGPYGIAVDSEGNVYVTDYVIDRVQIFDTDGAFVGKWGQGGTGDGELNEPSGFCLFGDEHVFLADAANDRVQRLTTSLGTFLSKVGENGTGNGQFIGLRDVCYDIANDQIIVADSDNDRIQVFQLYNFGDYSDNEMVYIKQISDQDLSNPMGVACANEDAKQVLYIADTDHNKVIKVEVQYYEAGNTPLWVWEEFKVALLADDIDKAVTFFSDTVADTYETIFTEHSDDLLDMLNDMGDMSLDEQDGGMAIYELSNSDSTRLYPVIFSMDNDGNWKISIF